MRFQDNADIEFSVIKTAIARYLKRSNTDSPDYIEIKDSKSVVEFCRQHLLIPSKKADLQKRIFKNIPPEVFLERKDETPDKIKTLAGISTKYQYICEVVNKM